MAKKIARRHHSKPAHSRQNWLQKLLPLRAHRWLATVLTLGIVIMIGWRMFSQPEGIFVVNNTEPLAQCGLINLEFNTRCGKDLYQGATITCADGTITQENSPALCRPIEKWYTYATMACQDKCVPSPTPLRSSPPNPCSCPPGAACKLPAECNPSPAPSGCTYKQVQCIQAPCDPVLECNLSSPRPQACTKIAGSCLNNARVCQTFSDGCQQAKICATPYQGCEGKPIN